MIEQRLFVLLSIKRVTFFGTSGNFTMDRNFVVDYNFSIDWIIKFLVDLRDWLNYNAIFDKTSEAKPLCFSLCPQMFDDVERC